LLSIVRIASPLAEIDRCVGSASSALFDQYLISGLIFSAFPTGLVETQLVNTAASIAGSHGYLMVLEVSRILPSCLHTIP